MKKKVIGILLILLITFTLGMADVKYYWYEPSDEEEEDLVAVDVYEGGDVLLVTAGGKSDIYTSNDGVNWTKQSFEQDDKSWFAHTLSGNTDKFDLGG